MKSPATENSITNLSSHVYEEKEISRTHFFHPSSLAFTESLCSENSFHNPKNLLFHKTKIRNCTFSGALSNVLFEDCELENCSFHNVAFIHLAFKQTRLFSVSGLPVHKGTPTTSKLVIKGETNYGQSN